MSTDRNPYIWNLSASCAGVYLKQAQVWFPQASTARQSKLVYVGLLPGRTGLGLVLSNLPIDWWTWEYVCWPQLVELEGRNDLSSLYATNGVKMAEFLYPLLYDRLATLGRVPPA